MRVQEILGNADDAEVPCSARSVKSGHIRCTSSDQQAMLDEMDQSLVQLKQYDYIEHGESVSLIRKSHGLLLLLSDMDLARRVVPGKLFEYFATTNSILAIAPEGEVWKLMQDYPNSACIDPSDPDRIVEFLTETLERYNENPASGAGAFDANRYERKQLTAGLTKVLEQVSS